ncbi:helix-turn-helix domain-containing protein [Streptomyces cocklensis]|uniref:Helix-turn-helix domain-containing protein n=1 Tax=Actinacidiphila cocklensis TaxID=887465 RepID=A0A9W4DXK3_9ACTN|nr:helix-turn-helix domain-containing protein [Actinacidiphila cocklensis]MDD1060454.1 helix-turn-helix domain-containing protein [Actinacidiphila cocklensis]WSX74009.1 helix-turn-helix domain-containing protein [Streptomyces sp. NBC_00899]WSX79926.1 helix-turn-helix domain-containing protein [Streptomyces sp. NBC_00899]CAG6395355.1 Helix-turn-helix domain-containing protein [Actinacidiphila cocklensis]
MTDQDRSQRITDLDALKVFTHPLRIRLYRALFTARTATASHLADQVDEAVSLVSYHLRKMAAHGFIVEAPEHSTDGRERWWKISAERGFTFRSADFDDRPEGAAVLARVTRQLLATRAERYEQYLDEQSAWPREWTNASFSSEYMPLLNAAELQQMAEEIGELMQRWSDRGHAAEDAGDTEGREHVAVQMYGFPFRP